MTECAESAIIMLDGETSKYFDILQGIAQGCCTLSPTLFKVFIDYVIRMTANVDKSAIRVCNEDKKSLVEFKYKWGEGELLIVDQNTYLGVEI